MNILLASGSPRRQELMKKVAKHFNLEGIEFLPPNIDERQETGEQARSYVLRMAAKKSQHGYRLLEANPLKEYKSYVSIGVDTIVVFGDKILGKPKDTKEAKKFLQMLSNKAHIVYTAYSATYMQRAGKIRNITVFDKVEVSFNTISKEKINTYASSGTTLDKAGGYGIQDKFLKPFIKKVNGDLEAVIGMSTSRVIKMIEDILSNMGKVFSIKIEVPDNHSTKYAK